MREGPDHKSYYHECFLRGRPDLTKFMTRLVNPGKRLPDPKGRFGVFCCFLFGWLVGSMMPGMPHLCLDGVVVVGGVFLSCVPRKRE